MIQVNPLPKTSTGKIQKFQLRERAKKISGVPVREKGNENPHLHDL